MRSVIGYATPAAKAPFEKITIERRDLGPRDVLIKIVSAGVCHFDIRTGREEWGTAILPLVPGHEIAGTVAEIGSRVDQFTVGDRVGVGCLVDSCRECENCLAGEEQYCLGGNVGTYNAIGKDGRPTEGGYTRVATARILSSIRTSSGAAPVERHHGQRRCTGRPDVGTGDVRYRFVIDTATFE